MKLQPLLEYQFPEVKVKHVSKLPKAYNHGDDAAYDYDGSGMPKLMRDKNVKHLGTGHFSSAYVNRQRPHDVRKVSRPNELFEIDGFYFYIMALSKHPDNGNPYFPRFSAITIYKHEEEIVYSVQMERLESGGISRSKEIPMWERILGQDYEKKVHLLRAFPRVRDAIGGLINGQITSGEVIDKDLVDATEFIRDVSTREGLGIDIHTENVLMRRTPYGLQPVISDPLSFQR